ncbi:MAG: hypothetical protein WAT35_17420 [Tabrizicola sp.]|uniref:hypothetical protein n=1 Tax=Tabrizicola sp. TaxID=2005166 RepID=UPI001B7BF399|nr:hypothetical protein [Tabrizicola sp.]MCC6520105.1 hypothetical protein [Tabrizicola sp.]
MDWSSFWSWKPATFQVLLLQWLCSAPFLYLLGKPVGVILFAVMLAALPRQITHILNPDA